MLFRSGTPATLGQMDGGFSVLPNKQTANPPWPWHWNSRGLPSSLAGATWWKAKLAANVERDRETDRVLKAQGWLVIRVWEHEPAQTAADRIEAAVRQR